MKTVMVKVVTLVEVDNEFEGDTEAIVMMISGTLDNMPNPEEIDESLKGLSVGISYYDGIED